MNGFNPMAMINMMVSRNPNLSQYFQMAQQMTKGKSMQEIQTIANNLAKQKGVDMNKINEMMQQFMNGNMPF